jgi:ATP-dependent helicase/nuclease subunit B
MIKFAVSLSARERLEYLTRRLDSSEFGVLVVPEQFLFESERLMYSRLGARKIAAIDITGVSKLAAGIIAKFGEPKLYADDIVKSVTMYKTLAQLRSRLGFFKGAASYDFARQMLGVAADFKAAAITPDALRDTLIRAEIDFGDALQNKLADICEIYSVYCDALQRDFADKLDDNRIAAGLIALHDALAGKQVFIHEFDSFSASQIGLIQAIAASADRVEILLRSDVKIAALMRDRHEYVELGGSANSPQIELWTADNVIDECEFVAGEIRRLISREGYTLNDIAVIACNPANTVRLKEVFAQHKIACYADLPEPILAKPMVRFIISALEATALDTPKLLSYIRSGFVRVPAALEQYDKRELKHGRLNFANKRGNYRASRLTRRLSKRSMDLLERAAFKYALKRREWGRAFPQNAKTAADLTRLEPLRAAVVQPLLDLREACRDVSGARITELVSVFLLDTMQLQRTVLALCEGGDLLEHKSLSEEFRQLWDLVIDVFESLHSALGDFPLSLAEYTEVLRGVCADVNIAKPPQVLDAAAIGDIERSRFERVRAAFITGVNTGAFPRNVGAVTGGSFSGKDIEVMGENGLEIAANLTQRYNFERMLADKAMTLPSEKLYLCAPLSDAAWRELSLAPIFAQLSKAGLPVNKFLLQETPENSDVSENSDAPDAFESAGGSHVLLPETARKLFAQDRFSPTAIEAMCLCRFAYFCKYGLRLDIPVALNEDEPIALERGNIIHHCLDAALRTGALFSLNDAELAQSVEAHIKEYRALRIPQGFAQTKRQTHILMSFKAGIVRMLRHLREEFAHSGFRPADFEKKVDFTLGDVRLTGKIDRVDKLSEYVRVVDYKTGSVKMDLPSAAYGLNLQMLLYLFAETGGGFKPASALYLPSDGLRVDGGSLLPNSPPPAALKSWLKAHKPGGIVIADDSPAFADFAAWERRFCSDTGARKSGVEVLSPAQFDKLREHCTTLISERVGRVRGGEVQAIPTLTNDSKLCERCDYGAVCGVSERVEVDKELIKEVLADDD